MVIDRVAPAACRRHIFLGRAFVRRIYALLFVALGATPAAAQRPVDLHVFRFWRPPDLTLVEAFTSVPLSLLKFERAGAEAQAIVNGELQVLDSAALVIFRSQWQDTVRVPAMSDASLSRSDASQHFAFQLKPGKYTLRLHVTGDAGAQTWSAEETIVAFAQRPRSSDLVVAGDLMRINDENPAPANAIVRGTLGVLPNFTGALTPEKARVALYTEVYRPNMPPESAFVQIGIAGKGNDFRYVTPRQPRIYPTGIGSEAFALDLTGLPPGDYELAMHIALDPDTILLQHPLQMLPIGAGAVQLAQTRLFEDKSETELDSIFGPMRYIATNTELDRYRSLAGATPKRNWLTQFWERRAMTLGEPVDALLRDWMERVQYVNRDFAPTSKGARYRTGWETDRGRIYIKYGPPAERQVSYQSRTGDVRGCELWQYTTGRGDRFVFFDRTGFRDFELVYSTDRNEVGIPGYESYFSSPMQFSCTEPAR